MGARERPVVPRFSDEEIATSVARGGLLTMEVEFNSNCDFNCIYCYAPNKPSPGEMSPGEWRDVITQGRDLGVRTVIVLGGEPMLYPHLMEMVRFIRGGGMGVEIFTNGAKMNEAAARALFDAGAAVVLKMNSFDNAVQDVLAGRKGAHRQMRGAFESLKAVGYGTKSDKFGLSAVICNQNYDELETLWRWIRDQGITPYFEILTPHGKAKDNDTLTVDRERLRILFERLAEADREYGFDWTPQPALVGAECLRNQYSCVVKPAGAVYPCVGVDIEIGNVRRNRLADIIRNSAVLSRLRDYRRYIKGPCSRCERLDRCYGCRGAAYQMTGDYLASDPLCWRHDGESALRDALPADAAALVPHRPPMLLVDRLLEVGEHATVEATIRPDAVFVGKDGTADDVVFLELIAQAIAAHKGFERRGTAAGGDGSDNRGFLIGARNLKILGGAAAGDSLRIVIRRVLQYGEDLAVVSGTVFRGDEKLAEGEVKVWQAPAAGTGGT